MKKVPQTLTSKNYSKPFLTCGWVKQQLDFPLTHTTVQISLFICTM